MERVFYVMSRNPAGAVLSSPQETDSAAAEVKAHVRSIQGSSLEVDEGFVYAIIDLEAIEAARRELAESGFDLLDVSGS